jgi:hypothetical protein
MKETDPKSVNADTAETDEAPSAPQSSLKKLVQVVSVLGISAPLLMAPPAMASADTLNQLAFLREAGASSVTVQHPILQESIAQAQQGSEQDLQEYGMTYNQTYNQTYTESYSQVHTTEKAD